MKILVTGGSSLVGKYLISSLTVCGHEALSLGRNTELKWELGQEIPHIAGAELLIHLAHDRKFTLKQNVHAYQMIVASFKKPIIFISSLSAHSRALSIYGKSKYRGEQIFSSVGGTSLRVGIILFGKKYSGVIAQLERWIQISTIVPVPFRGIPELFVTKIEDLCDEILSSIHSKKAGIKLAAAPTPICLLEFCKYIQKGIGKKIIWLKIPVLLTNLLLLVFRAERFRPNFIDSLYSMSIQASNAEFSKLETPNVVFTMPKI